MAEDYANRILDLANKGCVAIILSLARETGIIDVLKTASKPFTSAEIAAKKNLKERYVREALGALVAARFVRVSTTSDSQSEYYLTEEEKAAFEPSNIVWPFVGVPGFMAQLYQKGIQCFKADGPYGFHYGDDVHNVMEDFSIVGGDSYIESFFTNIPDLKEKLEFGIDVAEFGCGRGVMLSKLAQRFPKSRFTASEYSEENVKTLQEKYSHIPNLSYARHDLCNPSTNADEQYDWTFVCDVIHDLPRPQAALEKLRKLTRKQNGGLCSLIEPSLTETGNPEEAVGDETAASFYAMSVFTCVPESFENEHSAAMGAVYGKQRMTDMATTAGFQVARISIAPEYSLFVCT